MFSWKSFVGTGFENDELVKLYRLFIVVQPVIEYNPISLFLTLPHPSQRKLQSNDSAHWDNGLNRHKYKCAQRQWCTVHTHLLRWWISEVRGPPCAPDSRQTFWNYLSNKEQSRHTRSMSEIFFLFFSPLKWPAGIKNNPSHSFPPLTGPYLPSDKVKLSLFWAACSTPKSTRALRVSLKSILLCFGRFGPSRVITTSLVF